MDAKDSKSDRAERARVALAAHAEASGNSGSPEETARDLVTDLLHLADTLGFEGDWMALAARQHLYEAKREMSIRDQLTEYGERRSGLRNTLKEETETIKGLVRKAHADGMSEYELARLLKVSKDSIRAWLGK